MLATSVRNWVVTLAQGQWEDFVEYTKRTDDGIKSLFDHNSHDMPNETIVDFLYYAAQIRGAVDASVVYDELDTEEFHPKAVSWLARVPDREKNDFVVVKIDFNRLRGRDHDTIPGASIQQIGRIVRALCLHEIGHLFMHWDQILDRAGNARWAHPTSEAQAWCFAHTLICMAFERISMDFVKNPNTSDHVWEHMRDSRV